MGREDLLTLSIEEADHCKVDPLMEELVVPLDEELQCLHKGRNHLARGFAEDYTKDLGHLHDFSMTGNAKKTEALNLTDNCQPNKLILKRRYRSGSETLTC